MKDAPQEGGAAETGAPLHDTPAAADEADEAAARGWFSRFWRRRQHDEAIEEGLEPDPEHPEDAADPDHKPNRLTRIRRRLAKNAPIFKSSSFIALEVAATLVALLLGVVGMAWWWLSQGPQQLAFLEPYIESELSEARDNRPVDIDRVELMWTAQRGLQMRAVDVRVLDSEQRLLSTSREVAIGISPLHLLIGQVRITRADFVGGDVSIARKRNGETHIAFGPLGSTPDMIIAPPPANETLDQRVNRILDGLEQTLRPVGPGGRLRSLSVTEAHLTIADELGGGEWTAESASFQLRRRRAELTLEASARLEGPRGLAPAEIRISTDTSFSAAQIEFATNGVRPSAILSPAAMGIFAGLDAPLDATILVGLDREAGVTQLEGDITLGRGSAQLPGGRFAIDGGRVHGAYDLARDVLTVDQISLAGARNNIDARIEVANAAALLRTDGAGEAAFAVTAPAMTLDVPGVFGEVASLRAVNVAGIFNRADLSLTFSRIEARIGEAQLSARGRLFWAPTANGETHPGAQFEGTFAGTLEARDVVRLWPLHLAEGARDYLGRAVVSGDVLNARFAMNIAPEDVARGALPDAAVDLTFDFAEGHVRFLPEMSPLTGARGRAVLQGNRFDLWVDEGRVEGLTVTEGRVELPRLSPRGALGTISLRAAGDARSVVTLLRQEPIGLEGRLPVQPDTVVGTGALQFTFQRPMLRHVPYEDLRFTVSGQFEGVGGTERDGRIVFADGRLSVRGDQRAITISGPVRAGESSTNVEWVETLTRGLAAPSRYQISGDFDTDDLAQLGYPIREVADGRVGVTLRGAGRGYDVDSANVVIDLRNAAVTLPRGLWTKRAGVAASARFDVSKADDGSTILSNVDVRGPGLTSSQGEVRITRDDHFARAVFPRVQIAERADARISIERAADGAYVYDVSGAFFDATPWMDEERAPRPQAAQQGQPTAQPTAARVAPAPIRGRVRVERLGLRSDAVLADARAEFSVTNNALIMLTVEGRDPQGGAFTLGLGPRPNDPQGRITLRAADAGFAAQALTGSTNVRGGVATVDGVWTPGANPRAEFTVRMRDFTAVRVPAMTRLLSSVASLRGLAEMLGGDGISFTSLEAPVVMQGGRITIGESRAAGPSLGLTASGSYDTRADNLDIDGVVVPSFGLNSMLGNLPVVGEIFVSREGEGVFGMTYSMNGPIANARVGVNPVSALAPGILRRIFEPVQREQGRPAE